MCTSPFPGTGLPPQCLLLWRVKALPALPLPLLHTVQAGRGVAEAMARVTASCKDRSFFPLQSIAWKAHAAETDGAFFLCSAITWHLQRRMRWLHECKTADFNTRNSNSPLCKERERELFLTDIPLQFSCDGICVSLSGAQGQILLIKS